jgi:hypothetical protein
MTAQEALAKARRNVVTRLDKLTDTRLDRTGCDLVYVLSTIEIRILNEHTIVATITRSSSIARQHADNVLTAALDIDAGPNAEISRINDLIYALTF